MVVRSAPFLSLVVAVFAILPSPVPRATTLATSRFTIDTFSLATNPVSDALDVSVGSRSRVGDAGALVATAVLFQTPFASPLSFFVSRVDVLLWAKASQPPRLGISDFMLALFADDGSIDHGPGVQLAPPSPLVTQAPQQLQPTRAVWYQLDQTSGWPQLSSGTYYWAALLPGQALATSPNGAAWSGINVSVPGTPQPAGVAGNPDLFTARELTSLGAASSPGTVAFMAAAANWSALSNATARYVNWRASGSSVRYGIQVNGFVATTTMTGTGSSTPSATATRSQSSTRSVTRTPSLTQSSSLTATPTQSGTPSATSTPSFTATASSTGTRTVSGTRSQSQTQSPSVTLTASCTQSPTVSSTASQGASPSVTQSGSGTPTVTQTASVTETPSSTGTPSVSPTPSSTQTATVTQSASVTETPSTSSTASVSSTPSSTQTASSTQSHTVSATPTQSGSPSATLTPSFTATVSSTGTRTLSGTPSQTQSQTPSATLTRTASGTPSATQTPSGTQSRSQTSTRSPTGSPSASGSPSGSGSPSASGSPSLTGSASETQSPSTSGTPSFSATPSVTGSPSPTSTRSATGTPSARATRTSTSTRSQSPSPSQTQSRSLSDTRSQTTSVTSTESGSQAATRSQTQSATQSSTPSQSMSQWLPIAMSFTSGGGASSGGASAVVGAVTLSDSLPSVTFGFALSRCPPVNSSATLVCGFAPARDAVVVLLEPVASGGVACSVATLPPSQLLLAVLTSVITLRPAFRSGPAVGPFICQLVASDGGALATATVTLTLLPTLWPMWSDALIISQYGDVRSMLFATSFNVSSQLLSIGASAALRGLRENSTEALRALHSIALPLLDLLASISPPLPPHSATESVVASFTLTGPYLVALRAREQAFSPNVSATLGGISCAVLATSLDGQWVVFRTPHTNELCSGDADCGYQRIELQNPPLSGVVLLRVNDTAALPDRVASRGRALAVSVQQLPVLGTGLSFPPFCEDGCLPAGAFPVFVNGTPPSYSPAAASATGAVTPLQSSGVSSLGIFYARSCNASGLFTDPSTGGCTNASDPASFFCAVGSGDDCSVCPVGGLCPGGSRVWPRAGYWVPLESVGVLQECPGPDPTARCVGWSAATGSTRCGAGYRTGSFLCDSCAPQYYEDTDGSCIPCPVLLDAWGKFRGILILISIVIGIAIFIFAILLLTVLYAGGSVSGGVGRALALVVWSISAVQVVSLVGTTASDFVAPALRSMLGGIAVLQMESVLRPPACTGEYAFNTEQILLLASCCVWTVAVAAYYLRKPCASACSLHRRLRCFNACTLLGRIAISICLVAFPAAATAAVRLLDCTTVSVPQTPATTSALDGAPDITQAAQKLIVLSVLRTNPFFVCWSGSHNLAGVYAVTAIGIFVLGFPLTVFAWLALPACGREQNLDSIAIPKLRSQRSWQRSADRTCARCAPHEADQMLAPVVSDFLPIAWYTKFVDLGLLFILAVLHALLPAPDTVETVAIKAGVSAASALAVAAYVVLFRPFQTVDRWKGPVRALLLLVSACSSILNATATAVFHGWAAHPSLPVSVTVGSYLLLILWVIALIVLFVGFGRALWEEALLEARGFHDVWRRPKEGKMGAAVAEMGEGRVRSTWLARADDSGKYVAPGGWVVPPTVNALALENLVTIAATVSSNETDSDDSVDRLASIDRRIAGRMRTRYLDQRRQQRANPGGGSPSSSRAQATDSRLPPTAHVITEGIVAAGSPRGMLRSPYIPVELERAVTLSPERRRATAMGAAAVAAATVGPPGARPVTTPPRGLDYRRGGSAPSVTLPSGRVLARAKPGSAPGGFSRSGTQVTPPGSFAPASISAPALEGLGALPVTRRRPATSGSVGRLASIAGDRRSAGRSQTGSGKCISSSRIRAAESHIAVALHGVAVASHGLAECADAAASQQGRLSPRYLAAADLDGSPAISLERRRAHAPEEGVN